MKKACIPNFLLLTVALLLITPDLQAQFTLSAEVRPRAEFRNGFKTVRAEGEDPAFFVEQRSRLNALYRSEKLRIRLSLQDVRVWGSTSQVYKTDPNLFNVYEAYGEYLFSPRLSVRVGRQELDYDNARFLGNLDWAQQGRSHDALKVMFADSSGFSAHAGAGFNQVVVSEPAKLFDTFYPGVDNYKTMQFLWLHQDWDKGKLSALIFNDGRQKADSTVAFRQTYGLTGQVHLQKIIVGAEAYFQGGREVSGKKVNAFLLAASATLATKLTPVTVGVDYLSGTGRGDTKNRAFVPLYGTNHAFYGFMDYFYVGNHHGQEGRGTGLVDYYLKTNFKLGPKSTLLAHFHHFQSPQPVYAPVESDGNLSRGLGEEIDLVYNQNVTPEFNFKVGYSQLFASNSMDALKGKTGSGLNQWAWVMLTFKPVFLNL